MRLRQKPLETTYDLGRASCAGLSTEVWRADLERLQENAEHICDPRGGKDFLKQHSKGTTQKRRDKLYIKLKISVHKIKEKDPIGKSI